MATPCRRLGNMLYVKKVVISDELVSIEKIKESKLTLFGKLLNNPNINFQAFQNTMRKAW